MKEYKIIETEGHYLGMDLSQEEVIISIGNCEIEDDRKSIPIAKEKLLELSEFFEHVYNKYYT